MKRRLRADEARRQLLEEWQNVSALELTTNDYITCCINSVNLKNRLGDIETNCRDRLHVWLLRIVGALTAPTSMALACRWRSRPQHQKLTYDTQSRRCRHLFHERARDVRSASVDNHHPEPADHRMTEDRAQHGEWQTAARRRSISAPCGHAAASAIRAQRPAGNRVWPPPHRRVAQSI